MGRDSLIRCVHIECNCGYSGYVTVYTKKNQNYINCPLCQGVHLLGEYTPVEVTKEEWDGLVKKGLVYSKKAKGTKRKRLES